MVSVTRPILPEMQGNHLGHLLALARLHMSSAPLEMLSHSASALWDTQDKLPPGIAMQKSLMLLLDGQLVLVCGVEDFCLERWQMKTIARLLSLPVTEAAKGLINPSWLPPEESVGLAEELLSPFFPPRVAWTLSLAAVVLLPISSRLTPQHRVAVLLSSESCLLVPVAQFTDLVVGYGLRYYPQIPVVSLPRPSLRLLEAPPFNAQTAKGPDRNPLKRTRFSQ